MNRLWKRLGTLFVALTLSLGASDGVADRRGGIVVEQGGGNVAATLTAETDLHLNAIRRGLIDEKNAMKNVAQMERIHRTTYGMTVARFDYTYSVGGKELTRVYHARSGRSIGGMIRASGWESTSSSSTASKGELSRDVKDDELEIRFYPEEYSGRHLSTPGRESHVRVRNFSPFESKIGSSPSKMGRDAELKALRHIEKDITDKRVTAGGSIRAYVSQMPCDSCKNAMREFSTIYGVEGKVYYLDSGDKLKPSRSLFETASRNYFSRRTELIRRTLQAGHVTQPVEPVWGADTSKMLDDAAAVEQTGLVPEGCD